MDMQNVSNLTIPEGQVRTIHSKDSRLIWGRVAYNTKYAGDTSQQTYTGRNLSPYPYSDGGSKVGRGITFTAASDGSVTLNGTNDGTANSAYYIYYNDSSSLQFEAGTYYFIPPSNTNIGYVMYDGTSYYDFSNANNYSQTFSSAKSIRYIYIQVRKRNTAVFNNLKIYPMLTTLPNPTESAYEPYVGGIPSPNPDYPQDVNVVTGEQTITISDGINSEAFPISLGSIELCKIGAYQDYIYKSGDDWYVHNATMKAILNGTEEWELANVTTGYTRAFIGGVGFPTQIGYCDRFTPRVSAHGAYEYVWFQPTTIGGLYIQIKTERLADNTLAAFKAWLSNNPTKVVYALSAATDTKITDATLVGQLNTVHQWLTRYGYNATVSGDLPIVLQRDSLQ